MRKEITKDTACLAGININIKEIRVELLRPASVDLSFLCAFSACFENQSTLLIGFRPLNGPVGNGLGVIPIPTS
jgi:hypothetical protein